MYKRIVYSYYNGDEIRKSEMNETCSTHGKYEKCTIVVENLKGRNSFGDLGVEG
jgi:hypothetical protein